MHSITNFKNYNSNHFIIFAIMKIAITSILILFAFIANAQNSDIKLKHELKIFTTKDCFQCLVFNETILQNPYFQTYAASNLLVSIHHSDSLASQEGLFKKYNAENIYPTIALINPYKDDFIRLPFNDMRAEDFVYLIGKLRR